MKLRFRDRLLSALAGLMLVAGAAALVADSFFDVGVTRRAAAYLQNDSFGHRVAVVVAALLLLALGLYLVFTLVRHQSRRKSFVTQKGDDGELSISMKTLDSLVKKCINQDEDLHVSATDLTNRRDGLVIDLKATAPAGVNIPLVTANLQKQIKAYVTACSGVDVKEVQVRVESMSDKEVDSVYSIAAPQVLVPGTAPALAEAEEARKPALHQRLFGHKDQPADLPPAPETAAEPPAEDAPAETADTPADAVAADAEAPAADAEAPAADSDAAEANEASAAADAAADAADSDDSADTDDPDAPRELTPDAVDFAEMAAETGVWNRLPGEEDDQAAQEETRHD